MKCRICNDESNFFAEGKILNKYNIKYYKCPQCSFLQTEEPYWLDEAYKDAINRSDVGYVSRNIILSKTTSKIISFLFNAKHKFLDYGAGYGLFVRLMRDRGYDFYWQDKYCENIFAADFEADENESGFELLTGFELFEHLVNPIDDLEKMLEYSKNIFISTEFHPVSNPKPGEWWYYGEEHGQHVSIFSKGAMEYIARKYNLYLLTNNKNIHLLSNKKKSNLLFKVISYYYTYLNLQPFAMRKSLLQKDYNVVLNEMDN